MIGKFSFGSFYGLTGPTSLIISSNNLQRYLKIASSQTSNLLALNLKIELQLMEEILDKIVEVKDLDEQRKYMVGFDDERSFKKYMNDYTRVLAGDERIAKRFTPRHTKEEFLKLKENIENVPTTIGRTLRVGDNNVTLSEEQFRIVKWVYERKNKIQEFKKAIEDISGTRSFGIEKYFDRHLIGSLINARNAMYMNDKVNESYVERLEELGKVEQQKFLEQWKKDCINILSKANDNEDEIDLKESLNVSENETPQKVFEELQSRGMVFEESKEVFYDLYKIKAFRTLFDDLEAFQIVMGLAENMSRWNVEFFDKAFGLSLSQEEYEAVFRSLEELGLVGFNFYSYELFKDMLIKTDFSQIPDPKVKVSEDSELYKNTMMLLQDIESKLYHMGG